MSEKLTIVTGLWDIKRENLSEGWSRSFKEHYLDKFKEFLEIPENLIIYLPDELHEWVYQYRDSSNTYIRRWELYDIKDQFPFYDAVQKIRTDPDWYNQTGTHGWLANSTQAKLPDYNPLVMSKMFRLNDATIFNPFQSTHFVWFDAGISNTVDIRYLTHDRVFDKLIPALNDMFTFIAFPYDGKEEIHGFKYSEICRYAGREVTHVGRGGLFGGSKESIRKVNSLYYHMLGETLSSGYMGTEESIFSILMCLHPELIQFYEIGGDGLIFRFFEDLKNDAIVPKVFSAGVHEPVNISQQISVLQKRSKTALYVIGFNSPNQLEKLCESFEQYDTDFLQKPEKFLLNNSTDVETFAEYERVCARFGFQEIRQDNLGICGGRQFIAEHFDSSDNEQYFFFEDDMLLADKNDADNLICPMGFNRIVADLYESTITCAYKLDLDFIKLSFSEFFGENSTQWAWYNVPQSVREKFWPEHPTLPVTGLDPNAPKTLFKHIYSFGKHGISCITGDVFYSNWPQLVTRRGNKKMFLDTTWVRPYEQTWMSHMFQMTKQGDLNGAVLLASPICHNRFDHYDKELRKES